MIENRPHEFAKTYWNACPMLKIRQEQIGVLAQRPQREFQKKMVAHAQQLFPDECKKIGALNLEKFVQDGLAKAEGYGIEDRTDVAKFINLHVVFGAGFDHTCVWASEILNNASITSGAARVAHLNDAAMHELQRQKLR
jgi:hypothetical protein